MHPECMARSSSSCTCAAGARLTPFAVPLWHSVCILNVWLAPALAVHALQGPD